MNPVDYVLERVAVVEQLTARCAANPSSPCHAEDGARMARFSELLGDSELLNLYAHSHALLGPHQAGYQGLVLVGMLLAQRAMARRTVA